MTKQPTMAGSNFLGPSSKYISMNFSKGHRQRPLAVGPVGHVESRSVFGSTDSHHDADASLAFRLNPTNCSSFHVSCPLRRFRFAGAHLRLLIKDAGTSSYKIA